MAFKILLHSETVTGCSSGCTCSQAGSRWGWLLSFLLVNLIRAQKNKWEQRWREEEEEKKKHAKQLYFLIQLSKIRICFKQGGEKTNEDNLREFKWIFYNDELVKKAGLCLFNYRKSGMLMVYDFFCSKIENVWGYFLSCTFYSNCMTRIKHW